MTPNVSRLLIKWGVADVIGENLVEYEELNLRRKDGTKIGYTKIMPNVKRDLGFPFVFPFLVVSSFFSHFHPPPFSPLHVLASCSRTNTDKNPDGGLFIAPTSMLDWSKSPKNTAPNSSSTPASCKSATPLPQSRSM